MFKRCIIILGIFLLIVFIVLCFFSMQQINKIHRDPQILMNTFYKYRTSNPELAQKTLLILLKQDNKYEPAIKELIQFYLQENRNKEALPWLITLHNLNPKNQQQTYKLAYVYYQLGKWQHAKNLFTDLQQEKIGQFKQQANFLLDSMKSYLPNYQSNAMQVKFDNEIPVAPTTSSPNIQSIPQKPKKIVTIPKYQRLLNQYYQLKNHNEALALQKLQEANKKYPNNIQVLKEKGFAAVKLNHNKEAIYYFKKAYDLTHDPDLALQLGYLYTCINKRPTAYQYFQWASQSKNQTTALSAENAMTNLSGLQIKALPKPYFSETFFTPFSQTRFGLTVRPFLTRVGVEQNNKLLTREYMFLRRTDDNKSKSLGEISQIYEDDVQIEGIGMQITPIPKFPLVGFLEGGVAYDLVYRNRDRWRGDLRSGLMYYNQFGVRPAYYDKLTFGLFYFSDLYLDAAYYSRYNNNIIGGGRTHQGFHLIQYHSIMINTYVTGRVILDTKRLFYNNFAEAGPGVAIIPTNRFNFQIRFEHLNGAYLPAGAIYNPYRQYYINNLVQLLFYVKI